MRSPFRRSTIVEPLRCMGFKVSDRSPADDHKLPPSAGSRRPPSESTSRVQYRRQQAGFRQAKCRRNRSEAFQPYSTVRLTRWLEVMERQAPAFAYGEATAAGRHESCRSRHMADRSGSHERVDRSREACPAHGSSRDSVHHHGATEDAGVDDRSGTPSVVGRILLSSQWSALVRSHR